MICTSVELMQSTQCTGQLENPTDDLESSSPTEFEEASKNDSKTSGRWTSDEHRLFLEAVEKFGQKNWAKITAHIQTRSVIQVRTHAQKYYLRLERAKKRSLEKKDKKIMKDSSAVFQVVNNCLNSCDLDNSTVSFDQSAPIPALSVKAFSSCEFNFSLSKQESGNDSPLTVVYDFPPFDESKTSMSNNVQQNAHDITKSLQLNENASDIFAADEFHYYGCDHHHYHEHDMLDSPTKRVKVDFLDPIFDELFVSDFGPVSDDIWNFI